MDKIKEYFNSCVNYWMSTGVSKWVATCRVIWWDCVDVWNTEKSWRRQYEQCIWNYWNSCQSNRS